MHKMFTIIMMSFLCFQLFSAHAMMNDSQLEAEQDYSFADHYRNSAVYALKYFASDALAGEVIERELATHCSENGLSVSEFLDTPVDEYYRTTLLHWAVISQRISIVSKLIAYGASVSIKDRRLLTPYDLAEKYKTEEPSYFAKCKIYKGRQEELISGQLERMTVISDLLVKASEQQKEIKK